MQSAEASVELIVTRWRCRNSACPRQTFSGCPAELASTFARRTRRVTRLVRLLAYAAGGRPAERLTREFGFPQSRDTLLRTLIQAERHPASGPRMLGIDDWAWRKGHGYGTIMVDLERREVIDVLRERSAAATARWLAERPGVEIVARDRCGLYAEGARLGAPAARQVADRFHLIQNLRQGIQQQFSRAPAVPSPFNPLEHAPVPSAPPGSVLARLNQGGTAEHRGLVRSGRAEARRLRFEQVKVLVAEGQPFAVVARRTGLDCRTVAKWSRFDTAPQRRRKMPGASSPDAFRDHLARRWSEGCTLGRDLLAEIRTLGYAGSITHLHRFLNPWRHAHIAAVTAAPAPTTPILPPSIASPPVAAALCVTPRGALAATQAATVDELNRLSPQFAALRSFAMSFRGILRGRNPARLDGWIDRARASGLHCLRQFAMTLRNDIEAARNAILEPWSNGQTEGQINKLKTLKRAMYGRAGIALLRARMRPLCQD